MPAWLANGLGRLIGYLLGLFGREKQENRELSAGLDAVRAANEAAREVDPSEEAIENDPANLDRPAGDRRR